MKSDLRVMGNITSKINTVLLIGIVSTVFVNLNAQQVKPYAPEIFNPSSSGAVCSFSADGKTMFFVREDTIADKLFIYQAAKSGRHWADVEVMPFSGEHNDMGGRLSPDRKKFYFTSDRPHGSSKQDDLWNIWGAEFANNKWQDPVPLLQVNDQGAECCPVPMPDGILLFSGDRGKPNEWSVYSWDGKEEVVISELSDINAWQWPSSYIPEEQLLLLNSMNRLDSKGMDDVYASFKLNNTWSKPLNLDAPVNTDIYEDGAILSPDKKYLIFNKHETGMTPSLVMCVKWRPVLRKLKGRIES